MRGNRRLNVLSVPRSQITGAVAERDRIRVASPNKGNPTEKPPLTPAKSFRRLVALDFGFADVWAACTGGILGHRQITDAWLLTAAIRSGMKLLTFDAGVEQLLANMQERSKHVTVLHS